MWRGRPPSRTEGPGHLFAALLQHKTRTRHSNAAPKSSAHTNDTKTPARPNAYRAWAARSWVMSSDES